MWGGLSLWLASYPSNPFLLNAEGPLLEAGLVPNLLGKPNTASTLGGLLEDSGLYLLLPPPEENQLLPKLAEASSKFELCLRSFGSEETAARRLVDHILAWERAGRPSAARLQLKAYAADSHYQPAPDESVILKRWAQIVLKWK